jgi:exosortase
MQPKKAYLAGLTVLFTVFLYPYVDWFANLITVWVGDAELSYGALIPPVVAFLIWSRRDQLRKATESGWNFGLLITLVGCVLLIMANLSSNLLLGSLALTASAIGLIGFVWGKEKLRITAAPLSLLILMAPIPSYLLGELSWYLKVASSAVSSGVLRVLGIAVYQDGNLLRLPHYILEVREACSGTRSVFALIALSAILGVGSDLKLWKKIALLASAPILALVGNIIRIVGTGLLAVHFESLVANESLHLAWGIAVFCGMVTMLLCFVSLLKWIDRQPA